MGKRMGIRKSNAQRHLENWKNSENVKVFEFLGFCRKSKMRKNQATRQADRKLRIRHGSAVKIYPTQEKHVPAWEKTPAIDENAKMSKAGTPAREAREIEKKQTK